MILPHSIHHPDPLLHPRSDSNPSDNTTQVIVGVVIGGVVVIAMTAGILIYFLKKRKRNHAVHREEQSLALHASTTHGRKSRENDPGTGQQRPPSSLSFPHPIHTVGAGVDARAHNQSPSPPPAYQPRLPVYDPSRYQRVDAPQHQMGWPSVPMPSHMQAHAYTHTHTQRPSTHLAPTHPTPNYLVSSQQQYQHQHQHQYQHQHQQQYYLADGAPVPYPQPPLAVPHSETNTNRFSFEPRQSWAQTAPEDLAVARAAPSSSSPASSPPIGGATGGEEDRPAGETSRPRKKRPVLSRLITNLG
ncbi:hypothetical protein BDW42DRAFT_165490 [Aspergillus taichungensis]|uniref:Uncharacterized protein n=1 Tax=Aspergillus taichungensis TaxID=482145 RepID=A0A2J5HZZ9_9EURO|nr:hypothetical protein BDW42DRAFT_165490 [Aspergillus taichungensis]